MKKMELMAPAGNLKSFIAAIEGGADSVYLGYLKFNARRPADNFDAVTLQKITAFAHEKGRRVYLTLNIDLKPGELYDAVAVVELAVRIGVDAVIVKDLGLIEILRRYYQDRIELHASTQTAITSSAGAVFAEKNGFRRIVLARELDNNEIRAVTDAISIETEIFVEGSMCFSVSGRCLMSSWVGGRSGNRGGCTAPCRLVWENAGKKYTFFSMKDMLLVTHLDAIAKSGVHSLKIEGRLKNFGWVHTITSIYRNALDFMEETDKIEEFKEELRQFSARETGEGHFYKHDELIGANEEWGAYKKGTEVTLATDNARFIPQSSVELRVNEQNILAIIGYEGKEEQVVFTKPQMPKKGRAGTLDNIKSALEQCEESSGLTVTLDQPEYTGSANQISKISEGILAKLKLMKKHANELPEIDEKVQELIRYLPTERKRAKLIGDAPDKILIDHAQFSFFAQERTEFIGTITAECLPDSDIGLLKKIASKYELIISLPHVIYERDLYGYRQLIAQLKAEGINKFEANSFTGLELLDEVVCEKYGGIGLPVLNHIAAGFLYQQGCKSLYLSYEVESGVMGTLSSIIDGSVEALVFAKLPLFISRVTAPEFHDGALFRDKIGTEIECHKKGDVYHFLSTRYFALSGDQVKKAEIYADHLTADIRYIKNIPDILRRLRKFTFDDKESSLFNFAGKLV